MAGNRRVAIGQVVDLQEMTEDWFQTYALLTRFAKHHVLLESGRGGRYSMIGVTPWAVIKGKNQQLRLETSEGVSFKQGPLLTSLRAWLAPYKVVPNMELPEFQGGLVGQWNYDLIREIEKLPEETVDDLLIDDLYLLAFDEVYVIDHQQQKIWFIAIVAENEDNTHEVKLMQMKEMWLKAERERVQQGESKWYMKQAYYPIREVTKRSFSENHFKEVVDKTKQYIAAGDVFQVNLSVRESRNIVTKPIHIYDCLRRINPSPYMGYFHTPDIQYVGASPELLVKVKGNEVSTRPIAGTRSRGDSPKADEALAKELLDNEKERAEHIMLVDLERNDLGRVCQYGTVEVDELMVIEKYSHVMHIVTNIKGTKADEHDTLDVIAATFPGGTITGAPKIRTMEIIEELEPVRRGPYTGSLGWIGFQGNMELNISIRTMVVKDGMGHVQAGAGIVIDSDPKAEYKESLKKAKALWEAKDMSETELASKISMS